MKRRFFLTIAVVLTVAIGGVAVLQYLLFRTEQFRLIDQQIESVASLLVSSDLTKVELKEFEDAANIIEDVTGGERPNQFVLIYNRKGDPVYRSNNAEFLPDKIPFTPTWQTIEHEGHFIRVLSVPLERHKTVGSQHRMLQTGIILDEALVRWREVGRYIFIYSTLIVILILLSTVILSRSLLTPLSHLAAYLRFMGSRFDEKQIVTDETPAPAAGIALELMRGKDEFGELVIAAQGLHDRISQALRATQVWTAQMAHEMKTPLTILQNALEGASRADSERSRENALSEAQKEVAHLNRLISGFLEWTAAENFPVNDSELHAIRLKSEVEELTQKFSRQYPDRLIVDLESNLRVFSRPGFVQNAVSNLISNALKYSPNDSQVRVVLNGNTLSIFDRGQGIPDDVMSSLGQPFNYGQTDRHGFGLGLAWVSTICRKYGWSLEFHKTAQESEARLKFPEA